MIKIDLFKIINAVELITRQRITLLEISNKTKVHRNKLTNISKGIDNNVTLLDLTKIVNYFTTLVNNNNVSNPITERYILDQLLKIE